MSVSLQLVMYFSAVEHPSLKQDFCRFQEKFANFGKELLAAILQQCSTKDTEKVSAKEKLHPNKPGGNSCWGILGKIKKTDF